MYIPIDAVLAAMMALARVHPFHGITYLACKRERLPVSEQPVEFRLDRSTKAHMEKFHRLCPQSEHFYQPFGSLNPARRWVNPDYASSGLQRINTSTFRGALRHEAGTPYWSWSSDYVDVLASNLHRKALIPALEMSIWLYHRRDIGETLDEDELVHRFFGEYGITDEEVERLFETEFGARTVIGNLTNGLVRGPATWSDFRQTIPYPPDVVREGGDLLQFLEVSGSGPIDRFELRPAERLTLITGDNGLGKTFLLECSWFALTGLWAGTPAAPREDASRNDVWMKYSLGRKGEYAPVEEVRFEWDTMDWPSRSSKSRAAAGLVLYARVDGSFSVWDPVKTRDQHSRWAVRNPTYTNTEVWDGRQGAMEGMVRDWSRWQNSPNPEPFQTFVRILQDLSPPDLGTLLPGELTRVHADPRQIPTIRHEYGEVPILFASAGVKRIIAMAYLMVWAWQEHQVSAELMKRKTEQRMVVLVDEIEAHLHPRWQRRLLPALSSVVGRLSPDVSTQIVVSTHSPLIMASAETIFDEIRDSLLHLRLADHQAVVLEEMPFAKQGEVGHWLTSSAFDLRHARSQEAELAIEFAKSLQRRRRDVSVEDVGRAHMELRRVLGPDDKFWVRWLAFAEEAGVEL